MPVPTWTEVGDYKSGRVIWDLLWFSFGSLMGLRAAFLVGAESFWK